MDYLGLEIRRGEAVVLQEHILRGAKAQGIETISIVILNSQGTVVCSTDDPDTEAAGAKALSALAQCQDTILFQYTWNESITSPSERGWERDENPLLDDGDLTAIQEKIESKFTLASGGVLIKSEHGASVIGAVGVVTGQDEILDHELASLRPRNFAVAV